MRIDIPQDLPLRSETPQTRFPRSPKLSSVDRHLRPIKDRSTPSRPNPAVPRSTPSRRKEGDREVVPLPRRVRDPRDSIDARTLLRGCPPSPTIGWRLRPEERKVLFELGRFRIIRTHDLSEAIYAGKDLKLEEDLRDLRSKGLVEMRRIPLRRNGTPRQVRRAEVATLTRKGRAWLEQSGEVPQGQTMYYGFVKPREMEHDSLIYRAFRDASQRIEREGGINLRIKLDFEIKAEVQKEIYPARKADPKRDIANIKQEIAAKHALPFMKGGIQIPDARIEFDRKIDQAEAQDPGSRAGGHEDIEVLTATYQRSRLRTKVQAGFRSYAYASERSTITAKIEDEHNMMRDIFDL